MQKLIYRRVSELKPHPDNPRVHPKKLLDKLEQSIATYGFTNPVLIDKDDFILAGHARCMTAEKMGLEEVPTITLELDDIASKAYLIADNKLNEMARWDKELLKEILGELEQADFDAELTGFSPTELNNLFPKEIHEDDFDVDAQLGSDINVTRKGDVWLLGKHRLICGDSTLPETYDQLMNKTKANLIITDPPYMVDYEGVAGKIQNDNLKGDTKHDFLRSAFANMHENADDTASAYIFHADTEGLTFQKAFADAEWELESNCKWLKNAFVMGRSPYQWQHEPCLFGFKRGLKPAWHGGKSQIDTWNFDKPSRSTLHPTMKPISLLAFLLENSSQENGIILDPFAGSGSTLMACQQLNRVSYNIELDEKFCDVIVERFKASYPDDKITQIRNGEVVQ